MYNFHLLKNNLKCIRVPFTKLHKALFLENECTFVLPIIDKDRNLRHIYRLCLCLHKNVASISTSNPNDLILYILPLFGSIKINNKKLKILNLYKYAFNKTIKFNSKFNLSIYLLLRNLS